MALPLRLGLATLISLIVVQPASAQVRPGYAHGVRAVTSHGKLVFVFTRAARRLERRVTGHGVAINCEPVPPQGPGLQQFPSRSATIFPVPPGRKLRTSLPARGLDWCEIARLARDGTELPVVTIPLTAAGLVFLDERTRAGRLLAMLDVAAGMVQGGRYPPAADVVAKLGTGAVVLASPDDAVAVGQYGLYSDQNQHVSAATVTPTGRRLFIDLNGDTVSTNVLSQINSLGDT